MDSGLQAKIGNRLRELREEREFSLDYVEEETKSRGHKIPRASLSDIERGKSKFSLTDIEVLSEIYDWPLFLLFEEVAAHSPQGQFPSEWTGERLFEEGKSLFAKGEMLPSAWAFERAAEMSKSLEAKSISLASAARAYQALWMLPLAAQKIETALDIVPANSESRCRTLCTAAGIYIDQKKFIRAREFIALAKMNRPPDPDPTLDGFLLINEALICWESGSFQEGLRAAEAGAAQFAGRGNNSTAAKCFSLAALCLLGLNDNSNAIRMAQRAEAFSGNRPESRCFVLLALGEVFVSCDLIEKGMKYLEEGIAIAKSCHFYDEIRRAQQIQDRVFPANTVPDRKRDRLRSNTKKRWSKVEVR